MPAEKPIIVKGKAYDAFLMELQQLADYQPPVRPGDPPELQRLMADRHALVAKYRHHLLEKIKSGHERMEGLSDDALRELCFETVEEIPSKIFEPNPDRTTAKMFHESAIVSHHVFAKCTTSRKREEMAEILFNDRMANYMATDAPRKVIAFYIFLEADMSARRKEGQNNTHAQVERQIAAKLMCAFEEATAAMLSRDGKPLPASRQAEVKREVATQLKEIAAAYGFDPKLVDRLQQRAAYPNN